MFIYDIKKEYITIIYYNNNNFLHNNKFYILNILIYNL